MPQQLTDKKIAIIVANGFEEAGMTDIQKALLGEGAVVKVVSPENNLVNGWQGKSWGLYFPVDEAINTALGSDFDAIVIPDGERSITKLAGNRHAARILRSAVDGLMPIVLVGEAVTLLVAAERAEGQTVLAGDVSAESLTEAGAVIAETDDKTHTVENLMTARTGIESGALTPAVLDFLKSYEVPLAEAA